MNNLQITTAKVYSNGQVSLIHDLQTGKISTIINNPFSNILDFINVINQIGQQIIQQNNVQQNHIAPQSYNQPLQPLNYQQGQNIPQQNYTYPAQQPMQSYQQNYPQQQPQQDPRLIHQNTPTEVREVNGKTFFKAGDLVYELPTQQFNQQFPQHVPVSYPQPAPQQPQYDEFDDVGNFPTQPLGQPLNFNNQPPSQVSVFHDKAPSSDFAPRFPFMEQVKRVGQNGMG